MNDKSVHILAFPGAWHGPWAFEKIVPEIEKAGHIIIGLHYPRTFYPDKLQTFDDYIHFSIFCIQISRKYLPRNQLPFLLAGFFCFCARVCVCVSSFLCFFLRKTNVQKLRNCEIWFFFCVLFCFFSFFFI